MTLETIMNPTNAALLTRLRRLRRAATRGVTLVEVLIVVAIMALIAGGVSFLVLPRYREAQVKTAKTNARNIRNVATQHMAMKGDCPTVATLIADKELDSAGDTKDTWGGEYTIACSGDDISVSSPGPDKKDSSQDDILVGPNATTTAEQ
jgi:general secretion pathway protein G